MVKIWSSDFHNKPLVSLDILILLLGIICFITFFKDQLYKAISVINIKLYLYRYEPNTIDLADPSELE